MSWNSLSVLSYRFQASWSHHTAERNRSGSGPVSYTHLLLTAPVSVWDIVFGKYLALVAVFAIPVVIMCVYPLIMSKFGTISYASAYTGILGFFLLGCANLAIGVFMSALTESQVIAAVLTFVFLFAFYMMNGISSFFSQTSMSVSYTHLTLLTCIS